MSHLYDRQYNWKANQIESKVVAMYSDHPSPSFKDKLSYSSHRMELRLFCCGVYEEDYVGKQVLDAGCGSGEYSCWFASKGAQVLGIDLSDGALKEAFEYCKEKSIEGLNFEKRSVLDTRFSDNSFDFIYCTGVLHHTPDPFGGFTELCRVLKPGGKILISLYNSFGMFPRELRRRVACILGGSNLDCRVKWGCRLFPLTARSHLKGERNDPQSALYDYFAIPHESLHSIGGVLVWFEKVGLEYVGSFAPTCLRDYPAMFAHKGFESVEKEFRSPLGKVLKGLNISKNIFRKRPSVLSRLIVQSIWFLLGINIFCMCGRKKEAI